MTGDGAVVRKWQWSLAAGQIYTAGGPIDYAVATAEHNTLAAHALAKAAEIERLTWERDEAHKQIAAGVNIMLSKKRMYEASEARTADLLKALERYGAHRRPCAYLDTAVDNMDESTCTCGLAAAKGGTV